MKRARNGSWLLLLKMVNYCRVFGCTDQSDLEKHLVLVLQMPQVFTNQEKKSAKNCQRKGDVCGLLNWTRTSTHFFLASNWLPALAGSTAGWRAWHTTYFSGNEKRLIWKHFTKKKSDDIYIHFCCVQHFQGKSMVEVMFWGLPTVWGTNGDTRFSHRLFLILVKYL